MTANEGSSELRLNEQQRLEIGQLAHQARTNPVVQIVLETIMVNAMRTIDAAPPSHTKEVMYAKQEREIANKISGNLKSLVETAEKILSDRVAQNSAGAAQQRQDEEAFGLNFSGPGGES